MSTTINTNTEKLVRRNGILYKEGNGRSEKTDSGDWVYRTDLAPIEGAEIVLPFCEHKGSEKHRADYCCVWEPVSGFSLPRLVKFMCKKHCKDIGTNPYWICKIRGVNY
jgi:hypothetical protein